MPVSQPSCAPSALRAFCRRVSAFARCTASRQAASIRGVVTDASGAKVTGATVVLISNGKWSASAVSAADGSFQILTGVQGRFYLVVSAKSFRQLETPGFYAGRLDIDRAQHGAGAGVGARVDRGDGDRNAHAAAADQRRHQRARSAGSGPAQRSGELAAPDARHVCRCRTASAARRARLFIRGGDSDSNKILLDGVSAGDLGGRFDFGPLSTTAVESAEVYRGPNSNLYGADAASGVVSLTTPHGTTSFPSFLFHGDAGNFSTSQRRTGSRRQRTTSWITWAHSVGCRPPTICPTTSTMWPRRRPTWAGSPAGARRFAARCTMAWMPRAFPMPGTFITLPTRPRRRTRTSLLSASIDNQTTADFHNTRALRPDPQARAIQPVAAERRGRL